MSLFPFLNGTDSPHQHHIHGQRCGNAVVTESKKHCRSGLLSGPLRTGEEIPSCQLFTRMARNSDRNALTLCSPSGIIGQAMEQEERMSEDSPRSLITQRIERAVAKTKEDLPALTSLLEAFGDLLVETAVIKAELVNDHTVALPSVDKDSFRQGVPFADAEMFRISSDLLKAAAQRIGPAIRKGFPKIEQAVTSILLALDNGAIDAAKTVSNLLEDKKEEIGEDRGSNRRGSRNPAICARSARQTLSGKTCGEYGRGNRRSRLEPRVLPRVRVMAGPERAQGTGGSTLAHVFVVLA